MRLVTLADGSPDGRLAVVDRDLRSVTPADDICPTLQAALERWEEIAPRLRARADALVAGNAPGACPFDATAVRAPLPRSYQWLDGSAYAAHGELMARVFRIDNPQVERPLMYQGMSHQFLSATEDVPLPSEADGIDFEGEFGIVTDPVPIGISASQAARHIRLVVQINDWSLRTIAPIEMKTGFGWVQAKPACSMAPVAVTPDELDDYWHDGRVGLTLHTWWNGELFGAVDGSAMQFSFGELVAHAARSRTLCGGTIIGSGTVSSSLYREVGSSCVAERRAIELLDRGAPSTEYLRFGDRVRMAALDRDGRAPLGVIDQRVVAHIHSHR
jgi:fumarylacetoacetate (FAA) hydrolase